MKRTVLDKLRIWQKNEDRKPLILRGARQVGKTWIMKEFGKACYSNFVYYNFDEEDDLKSIFETNKNPNRIIELLSLLSGQKIEPDKTLIILDEIQECPQALNSLKYFNEKAKDYHIISAGSLLGTLMAQPKSFPVGQVNIINVYPMTFDEFLMALDENLFTYYKSVQKGLQIERIFHDHLLEFYNYYLIIGGMPECVSSWLKYKDPAKIEQTQRELITIYENDFAKHSGKVNSGRILMVFRSIVSQLAKENEKFIYGCIRTGARAREYEEAIEWLVSAGMLNRLYNVTKPEHPLPAFDMPNHFKLFLFDTGLLKFMAGISNEAVLLKSDYQFKGALTENFVLQQLKDLFEIEPRFYSDGVNGEIDFIIQKGVNIIPVEVKSSESSEAKSLKRYIEKRQPSYAIRYTKMGYMKNGAITNIPLYLVRKTADLI
ncbi:MAG: ATP-binding protein [Clostridia bacterium]|nr:ATP-binding protein [Clostridia bacterium]